MTNMTSTDTHVYHKTVVIICAAIAIIFHGIML